MSANSIVSERIRQRREALRVFRAVTADQAGVPYARYCSIERGEVQITVDDLFKIAPALETTPAELLAGVFDDRHHKCGRIRAGVPSAGPDRR